MKRPISSNGLAQVQAAVFNGEKIAAIKSYREDTGASLKDAKEAVEKLEAEWRVTTPEKFKAVERKGGCGVGVVLLAIVATLLTVWMLVG